MGRSQRDIEAERRVMQQAQQGATCAQIVLGIILMLAGAIIFVTTFYTIIGGFIGAAMVIGGWILISQTQPSHPQPPQQQ